MKKKNLLFLDCCPRTDSRTRLLAETYLEGLDDSYEITVTDVTALPIVPYDEQMLLRRDALEAAHDFTSPEFALAHQFAQADRIVIAAPFWDCSFPAKFKVYLEHVSVTGLTFGYDENQRPQPFCKADRVVYITTAGGFLKEHTAVEAYLREYCDMLAIDRLEFYAVQGMDVYPDEVEARMEQGMQMLREAEK